MYKQALRKLAWEKPEYTDWDFQVNPAIKKLQAYSIDRKNILDLGCADGKVLEQIHRKEANFAGVDISSRSIRKARKRFTGKNNINFICCDLEKINFKKKFDLVYSTYTFEHLDNPELILEKMIGWTTVGGIMIVICPNYGSPVEYSPGSPKSNETLVSRAFGQFLNSWRPHKALGWRKVKPPIIDTHRYTSDADVTGEPYLGSLVEFLEKLGIETVEAESGIDKITAGSNILGLIKFFCLQFGKLGLWPFKYYGPRVFYVGIKRK